MKLWAERQIQLPSFIESDGLFITKPFDVDKYFKDDLIGKVG